MTPLYLFNLFCAVFILLTPILFHEMGHWILLRKSKVSVKEVWMGLGPVIFEYKKLKIGMLPLGAAVVPDPVAFEKVPPFNKMKIALAGPAFSIIYAIVCLFIWYFNVSEDLGFKGFLWLAWLNVVIAFLNLMPIPPLDGFRAFVHYREFINKPVAEKTLSLAYRAGNGFLYGVGFFVLGLYFF